MAPGLLGAVERLPQDGDGLRDGGPGCHAWRSSGASSRSLTPRDCSELGGTGLSKIAFAGCPLGAVPFDAGHIVVHARLQRRL